MKLDWKALSLTCAILWAGSMLVMGIANLIWPDYGVNFLQLMSSVYPGYHATRNVFDVIIGTCYGAVDGFVGAAVFAWLYNCFVQPAAKA